MYMICKAKKKRKMPSAKPCLSEGVLWHLVGFQNWVDGWMMNGQMDRQMNESFFRKTSMRLDCRGEARGGRPS